MLLSAALLRQARRQGLTLHVAGVGYLSASDVTVTAAKARAAALDARAWRVAPCVRRGSAVPRLRTALKALCVAVIAS